MLQGILSLANTEAIFEQIDIFYVSCVSYEETNKTPLNLSV